MLRRKLNNYGLWPTGETGITANFHKHSDCTQQPAVSLGSISEMSFVIQLNKEVHMEVENKNEDRTTTVKFDAGLNFKFTIIVAAVVGCLLFAPLTRAHTIRKNGLNGAGPNLLL